MSDSKTDGLFSLTAPVVMTFPNLFTARAFGPKGKERGEPKYSANFIFKPDHVDLKALKELAVKIARAKWPGVELATLKFPFTDGTKLADKRKEKKGKDDATFYRGNVIVAARSKFPPALAGIENGRLVDYIDAARTAAAPKFFSGAEVLAQFNFVAYDGVDEGARNGVTAYLNSVLATGKGTRLAGERSAAETFKGYVGHASTEDPTAGNTDLDDEIPF